MGWVCRRSRGNGERKDLERRNRMKKTIRIRTVSQWHLLKQINRYLGKKQIPEEVIVRIYYILHAKELGKDGFIVLCLDRIKDNCLEVEDAVGMYQNKIRIEEKIDEIPIRSRKGRQKSWYITHVKMKSQKIQLIYTTKGQDDYRRDGTW